MKITYDKTVDAKYIKIKTGKVFETKVKNDWLFIDYNKKGEVLGVEILDASRNSISLISEGKNILECINDSINLDSIPKPKVLATR